MKNVLILNAHQFFEGISPGRLNKTMAGVITEEMEERGYDINTEVQQHLWADLIILQSPVYWFGMPWIYKKYVDEVFTAGLFQQSFLSGDGRTREDPSKQYGTGGKMQDKAYMLSLTWNAPETAFGDSGQFLFEGKTVDDVFIANTANYKFCGARILPSFSSYDVLKAADIDKDIAALRAHLVSVLETVGGEHAFA